MAAQMAEAIGGGQTPFTEPVEMQPGVWMSEGLGQVHYFFAAGNGVWWISVDPALGDDALQQALVASKN